MGKVLATDSQNGGEGCSAEGGADRLSHRFRRAFAYQRGHHRTLTRSSTSLR